MKITQKKVENIVSKLSKKYNLPEELIDNMWRGEFEFINKTFREEQFKTVQLPGFGKFYVSIQKIRMITKRFKNCKYKNVDINELKSNRETNKDLSG